MKNTNYLCYLISIAGLLSCSSEVPDHEAVLPGDHAALYRLQPNDAYFNDSAARYLAEGVILPGQPGGQYELSFYSDSLENIPQLRLYRLFPYQGQMGYSTDQVLQATQESGKLTYRFNTKGSAQVQWLTVLESDGDRWNGSIRRLQFDGLGGGSDSLGVNIWIAGAFSGFSNGEDLDDFVDALESRMRSRYGAVGFKIGAIRVLMAHEHPQYGHLFPANEVVVAEDIEARFDSLNFGGDAPYTRAIDIVLIDHFATPGMLGLSPLYGLNLYEGAAGVIVLATKSDSATDYWGFESVLAPVRVSDLVHTIVHETGHFFGLRHTTTTARDAQVSGDASSVEDGLIDTPWCYGLEKIAINSNVKLAKQAWYPTNHPLFKTAIQTNQCPDQYNPMFPYSIEGEMGYFSPMQGLILIKNLRLFP